jgi:hypothetical protein
MNRTAELRNEFFLIQDWWRYQKVRGLNALLSPCDLGPLSGQWCGKNAQNRLAFQILINIK